ncbi:MAG: pseudouridine synthase [Elusimicrobia bacterium]|nr:pseudouridine synthase [Elusimicrobiota bacterium]
MEHLPGKPSRAILFNKPYGVISQFRATEKHQTLASFGFPPRFNPAGRLDADSEGLLLLTSDGALQHVLCEPRYGHPRTYLAQVEGIPNDAALQKIRGGIEIPGHKCLPCRIALGHDTALPPRTPPIRFRKTVPDSWVELTITEGKNRQVRKMLAAAGYPVLRLYRKAIGALSDAGLPPGRWRYLTEEEISLIAKYGDKTTVAKK